MGICLFFPDCPPYDIPKKRVISPDTASSVSMPVRVSPQDDPSRPRQMRRGWDMVEGTVLPPDEPETVNHLVFVVHGIGSWCDLKFRKVTECGKPRDGTSVQEGHRML